MGACLCSNLQEVWLCVCLLVSNFLCIYCYLYCWSFLYL